MTTAKLENALHKYIQNLNATTRNDFGTRFLFEYISHTGEQVFKVTFKMTDCVGGHMKEDSGVFYYFDKKYMGSDLRDSFNKFVLECLKEDRYK